MDDCHAWNGWTGLNVPIRIPPMMHAESQIKTSLISSVLVDNKKLQKLSVATMHNVFDNTFSHQNLKPVGVSAVDLSW